MSLADENKNNEQHEVEINDSKAVVESHEKKSKKADSVKPKESMLAEINGEFKKIVWPTRRELAKQTTTVIFVSAMFGVIIFLMDLMFGFGVNTMIDAFLS